MSSISAGDSHTCELNDGGVSCWGNNNVGQLGDGTTAEHHIPVAVSGLASGVTAISAAGDHTCAIKDGVAWCWGRNSNGELGNDSTTNSPVPVPASSMTSGVTAISAGYYHACAVKDGGAWCWGQGSNGRLGDDSIMDSHIPVPVLGLATGVSAISGSSRGTCALKDSGAWCWGYNSEGELGDGTQIESHVPVKVANSTGFTNDGVTAISKGGLHSCALKAGSIWCWGDNHVSRQLGTNIPGDYSFVPVPVSDPGGFTNSGVTAISAGDLHTCVVKDGGAWCWGGNNSGQLGINNYISPSPPMTVWMLESGVTAITAGQRDSCAMREQTAWCWGTNFSGQLGNNSTTDSPTPVAVGADSDGDVIPNDYESVHSCLNPNAADGNADSDADGLSNYDEFRFGSDPCTASHRKVIIMQGIDSAGWSIAYWNGACYQDRSAATAGYLKQRLMGSAGLAWDDIMIASWSGAYCDAGTDRYQPKYTETDTCSGVRDGASKLASLMNRVFAADPNVEFDLIGHSLGGLAVSFWVSQLSPDFVTNHIHSVTTLDSMVLDGQTRNPDVWPLPGGTHCNPYPPSPAQSWIDIADEPESAGQPPIISHINDYSRTTEIAPFVTINPTFIGDTLPGAWRDIVPCGFSSPSLDPLDHGCVWQDDRSVNEIRLAIGTNLYDEWRPQIATDVGWSPLPDDPSNAGYVGRRAMETTSSGSLDFTFSGVKALLIYQALAGGSATVRLDDGAPAIIPGLCKPYGYREKGTNPMSLCVFSETGQSGSHTLHVDATGIFIVDALEVYPGPSPVSASLIARALAGTNIVRVDDISVYTLGGSIRINPGSPTQEDRTIVGFSSGSLVLDSPLQFNHAANEPVAMISSVGGIAEQPDVTALPSRMTTESGEHRTAYAVATAAIVAIAGIVVWWYRRRWREA